MRHSFAKQVAEIEEAVDAVARYRSAHGRLPNPSPDPESPHPGYRRVDAEAFEISFMSFDGPTVRYRSRGRLWTCDGGMRRRW